MSTTTTVKEEDVDLQAILGTPGAILTPSEKKPSLFSSAGDIKTKEFLDGLSKNPPTGAPPADDDDDKLTPEEKQAKADAALKAKETALENAKKGAEILDGIIPGATTQTDDDDDDAGQGAGGSAAGRKKTQKDALIETVKSLIEEKVLFPFDGEKTVEQYSLQELKDLIVKNFEYKQEEFTKKLPLEFYDSLPEELQYAYKYYADGGKDLKSVFKVLSHMEENKQLDTNTEEGQKQICRLWLTTTNFGTPEEIEAEVNTYADRKELDKKAIQFKPKVEAKTAEILEMQLAKQEESKAKQQKAANQYVESLVKVLTPGEINGLKIDNKTQEMIYTGLVQPIYKSVSGSNTNLLGHLLEKYQFLEPNHALISEVLWHLADPDGFKAKLKEQGSTAQVVTTVNKLKIEQQSKNNGGIIDDQGDASRKKVAASGETKIPRGNMFRRI